MGLPDVEQTGAGVLKEEPCNTCILSTVCHLCVPSATPRSCFRLNIGTLAAVDVASAVQRVIRSHAWVASFDVLAGNLGLPPTSWS